ncbi:MAG: hypothetical protein HBSIN02_17970 [Bacteroidia bacterium]|nr:MAG: hypothetical protein HBSIN02_17970 [Bacteroidia bacterium]
MLRYNPEVAVICIVVGIILVARGWYALRRNSITVKKPIGFPWQYNDLTRENNPRVFLITTWGIIVLGVCFILFPFIVEYFV